MPLPLIIGGIGGAVATAVAAKALKDKMQDSSYYIKNKRSMYFGGIVEKRFLFIKYKKPQWVTHWNEAEGFTDEEEANDCVKQNNFHDVEIVVK